MGNELNSKSIENNHTSQTVIIVNKQKSVVLAFFLAFFFGPFGLFYVSIIGGVTMLLFPFIITFFITSGSSNIGGALLGLSTMFIWVILDWLICIVWAIIASTKSNNNVILNTKIGIESDTTIRNNINIPKTNDDKNSKALTSDEFVFKSNEKYIYPIISIIIFILVFYLYCFFTKQDDDFIAQNSIEENEVDSRQIEIKNEEGSSEYSKTNDLDTESELKTGIYIAYGSDSSKIFFHNSPNNFSRRKAFLNTVEKIYVSEIKNGFGYIEFTNNLGQKSKGWIEMSHLVYQKD